MTATSKTFPADFYVTVATVIPVLYLAIAIQGRTYEAMIKAAMKYYPTYVQEGQSYKRLRAFMIGTSITAVALALVLSSAISEMIALYALSKESQNPGVRNFIMNTMIALLLAVTIPPVTASIRAIAGILKSTEASKRAKKQMPAPAGSVDDTAAGSPGDQAAEGARAADLPSPSSRQAQIQAGEDHPQGWP